MALTFKKRLQKLSCDVSFLIGCAIFVYGLWLAWRPLGFIVGGIVVAAVAFSVGYQREKGESE